MMYDTKLVVAVMANGKVLREHQDAVYLPFGCEYSLRIKNLNTVKALVRISIDGQNATEGTTGLIVPPNSSIDLERFIKNGNLAAGNKFKFIERTTSIENGPRGIKVEDGLICVEFEYEKPQPIVNATNHHIWGDWYPEYPDKNLFIKTPLRPVFGNATFNSGESGGGTIENAGLSGLAQTPIVAQAATKTAQGFAQNVAGITVPGGISEQKFQTGAWFPTDGQKHVMVLRLFGAVGEVPIESPVTVKTQQRCTTCHHLNKSTAKFCSECGTGLLLA